MALKIAQLMVALDAVIAAGSGHYLAWSANGTSETGAVARTAVTFEAAQNATTYARKGVTVASPPQLSAAASSGVTVTHWAVFTASSGGTQKTEWNALTSPVALSTGAQININDLALYEKITPA